MNEEINIIELKDIIQDSNINFLFGSGMSMPYLSTLGKIEQFLTELADKKEKGEVTSDQDKIVRFALYKKYFEGAISKNLKIGLGSRNSTKVLNIYSTFLKIINAILLNRKSTILNKQINLFTTNIDIFFEQSLEDTNVEYNDGFRGRFTPLFNLANFKKRVYRTSLHYDNISELPVFNLMKIHGSLTWEKLKDTEEIIFSSTLDIVSEIEMQNLPEDKLIDVDDNKNIDDLVAAAKNIKPDKSIDNFIKTYEKLAIVNPTKEKFRETVLNRNYYELLRMYSNELEKENTILFIAGFSFADEHIRDVTVRALNSNPTLIIYIFSYSSIVDDGTLEIKNKSINNNIKIITPTQIKNEDEKLEDEFKYDFQTINERIFSSLLKKINEKDEIKRKTSLTI